MARFVRKFKRRRGTLKRKRGLRKRRVFGKRRAFRRRFSRAGGRVNVDRFRRTGDIGKRARKIRNTMQAKTFVRRSYESSSFVITGNTQSIDYQGTAMSLSCILDNSTWTVPTAYAEVYFGGLHTVGTQSGVGFENFSEEWASMSQVFRYFRIAKFQVRVSGLPTAVYIPTIPDPAGMAQQGFTYGSMADPGVFLLRSWGGGPAIAQYSNGVLTATDWMDHARYRSKKMMKATGHGSVKQLTYTVTPMRPMLDQLSDHATTGSYTDSIRYERAPAVDVNDFYSGKVGEAGGFGQIFYWYHPACTLATTGLLNTTLTFSMEVEYWGLKNTPELTPAGGQIAELADYEAMDGSKDHLLKMLNGVQPQLIRKNNIKHKVPSEIPGQNLIIKPKSTELEDKSTD